MSGRVFQDVPRYRGDQVLTDIRQLSPGAVLARVLSRVTLAVVGADARTARSDQDQDQEQRCGVDDAVSLVDLGDDELAVVAAGWERLISWARAAQGRVAEELMNRTDGILARDSAAGELAVELAVTTSESWQIAARGEGIATFPAVGEALAGGRIDAKKADTFLRAGAELTPTERGEAIEKFLPDAPGHTWRWISERMNAYAARLHGRKARHRDLTDRCNVWAESAGPGLGRIVADLPIADAAATFNAVQAAAGTLKAVPGETRPRGALRAAALTSMITGRLVLPCPQDGVISDISVSDISASDISAPDTGVPDTSSPDIGAPDIGVSDTSVSVGVPGIGARGIGSPDIGAVGADLSDSGTSAAAVDASAAGAGEFSEPPRLVEPVKDTDLIPVPEADDGLSLTGPAAAATRVRVVEVPATVQVTVPASALVDPEDMTPGVVEGIGPVPADDAARIAANGTWRRLLTDPVSGVLTDYSTRTYAPGAILRAAVTARDQVCTFPGCDRAATSGGRAATDLDHVVPFDIDHRDGPAEPGQTRADNLHPLCRKHHNLKTHAHWGVTRDPDTGVTHWTAPSRRTHATPPAVVDPVIRYGLAHGLTLAPPPRPRPRVPGPGAPDLGRRDLGRRGNARRDPGGRGNGRRGNGRRSNGGLGTEPPPF